MIGAIDSSGYSTAIMSQMRQHMTPDPDKISEKILSQADSDGDGKVSKSELSSLFESSEGADSENIDALLSQIDADDDGSISKSELNATLSDLLSENPLSKQMQQQSMEMPPPPPEQGSSAEELISSGDTDEDGSLNLSEFLESLKRSDDNDETSVLSSMFSDADADGDGKVTEEELQTAMDNHLAKLTEEGEKGQQGHMPPPEQGSSAEELISSGDTDEDGTLNLSEFLESLTRSGDSDEASLLNSMFNDADTDGDGKVTQEELQAAMENHQSIQLGKESKDQDSGSNEDGLSTLIKSLLQQYQSNNTTTESSSTLSVQV